MIEVNIVGLLEALYEISFMIDQCRSMGVFISLALSLLSCLFFSFLLPSISVHALVYFFYYLRSNH